tara:strand:+ start:1572 stop:2513 length:942 start_codon:yes stop_codon:yes gene_type:complete
MRQNTQYTAGLAALYAVCALAAPARAQFPGGSFELHDVHISPAVIVEDQPITVTVTGFNLLAGGFEPYQGSLLRVDPARYEVAVEGNSIALSYQDPRWDGCLDPTPPLGPNYPQRREFQIPGLTEGEYELTIDYGVARNCGGLTFRSAERAFRVYNGEPAQRLFNHEAPEEGQTVSGVGLIRGWVCYNDEWLAGGTAPVIGRLSYRVDDGPEKSLASGTSRTDTASVCGEFNTATGYGAVVYWGGFGVGEHEFTLLVDGEAVETTMFTVAAPSGGFLKGMHAGATIADFPAPGRSVQVEWSEADQNFVITEFN